MHFPSSEEGAGLEGDHATPTIDVGMQMLQVTRLIKFNKMWN